MIEVAEGVYQIPVAARNSINAYLIDGFLIDAGIRSSAPRLFKAIGSRKLEAHVLTHGHGDHQGASAEICQRLGLPLWCGAGDREMVETGQTDMYAPNPNHPILRFQRRFWVGQGHPVARTLSEGDHVGEFEVIATPGHSPGHLAFWRARDRVLIAGDVLNNMNLLTTLTRLGEPPKIFTTDPVLNRRSIKKIAALNPAVVCFGHGPVLRDPEQLALFAYRLPA